MLLFEPVPFGCLVPWITRAKRVNLSIHISFLNETINADDRFELDGYTFE